MENSVDYRILLQEKIFYIRLKAFAREYHKDKIPFWKDIYRISPTFSNGATTSTC